jgi:hypothetical protein
VIFASHTRRARHEPVDLQALQRDGYATATVFGPRDVRAIRAALADFDLPDDHGFFASPAFAPGTTARAFDLQVREIVAPALDALLPGYRPFMVAATTKGRRSSTPIKFHQDWTYTDERQHRPIFLWCPLVDVDEGNGALRVVPGSNRWTSAIRPSRRLEVTERHQDQLDRLARTLILRAGQAVVFDPATLHGSGPNPTDAERPAVTIAVAPAGAELVHFHECDDGSLVGAVVDDRFFTMHPYGTAPTGYPALAAWDRAVSDDDLAAALAGTAAEGPR